MTLPRHLQGLETTLPDSGQLAAGTVAAKPENHPGERRQGDPDGAWVPWRIATGEGAANENPLLFRIRLQSFRILAVMATLVLTLMVARGAMMGGPFPWADLGNAAFFVLALAVAAARPNWLRGLCWLGLAALLLNAVEGMEPGATEVVTPVLILLPLLILYGALLGDLWISMTAMVGVSAIYAYTWSSQSNLGERDLLLLTNLCVVTVFSGAAAFCVWLRQRQLADRLNRQAEELRRELDARLRVQALVVHDLRSPLAVLTQAAELADAQAVEQMARRISAILDSAGDLAVGTPPRLTPVTVREIQEYLRVVFDPRLARKEQTLAIAGDDHLLVMTDLAILCNSVLGNFIGNAMKFSPRGATIVLSAERTGDRIRLAVNDRGPGFPEPLLAGKPHHPLQTPAIGTEGEQGGGYGLRIATLCAERLDGRIEMRNRADGGAISVLLPAANGRSSPPTTRR